MKNVTIVLLLIIASITNSIAQNAAISGKVIDASNGDPLIGATVKVADSGLGAVTDIDGNFQINGLQAGAYNLQATYLGYQGVTINNIEVKSGQTSYQDFKLAEETGQVIEEIVIEAKADKANENALLTLQRKSAVVMDGVSAQQFARTGDGDAGAAARRVTGVSVEGGKYVYVRGLGDRYSKTLVNNAEVPGLDPNRNSVQLDVFPSNLLDNISVLKTYSADMPGDFTGGCVIINTKEFPDKFSLSASASLGYNTNATFNNRFLTSPGGKLDWLGFDDGTRNAPALAAGQIPTNPYANPSLADQIVKSFNKNMTVDQKSPFLNQNYNFSIGNKLQLGSKQLGILFALSYNNENEFFENGVNNRYILSNANGNGLTPYNLLTDSEGKNNVLVGAIMNTSLKINDNNKISLNLMRNHSGSSSARYLEGTTPFNTDESVVLQSNVLRYVQRSMNMAQLKGEHYFPGAGKLRLDWQSSFTYCTQDEPDFRTFTNSATDLGDNVVYSINPANYKKPSRFFRNLDEYVSDTKIFLTVPYRVFGRDAKFKTGLSGLYKNRTFNERRLDYEGANNVQITGSIDNFLSDEYLGVTGTDAFGNPQLGIYMLDATENRNQYTANNMVYSGFVMTDLTLARNIKLNAGVRAEYTGQTVTSLDPSAGKGEINRIDILPGVNLVFELMENMNLRASYSRTVARPTFREMAPFASYDFNLDFILVGNPNLNRALADNADIRWEYFGGLGEIYSASVFYKHIQNPIEKVFVPQAYDQITFRNVKQATVYGAEFEVRKNFGFVAKALENLTMGVNLSLIYSKVDIDPSELQRIRDVLGDEYPGTRRMFSQSPYLLNAVLGYANKDLGTELNVSFNLFGDRLSTVGTGTLPDLYEQARPTLNAMVSQSFGPSKRFKVTFRANNILNPWYNFSTTTNGTEYSFQKFRMGSDFSLGLGYSIK